jgi:co-chaperonin GroES (HSP10)
MSGSKVKLGDKNALPLAFGGHAFYCRKCFTGEHDGSDNIFARKIDNVYIPEGYADKSHMLQVLAKGPNVGQFCSSISHRKRYDRPRRYVDAINIDDLILCPKDSPGIKQSAFEQARKTEFFIEESVPVARQVVDADGTLVLEPYGDWIAVDIIAYTPQPHGDIEIGYESTAELKRAVVIQLGTGVATKDGKPIPFGVSPGDEVLVRHNIQPTIHNGNRYYFIVQEDIFAIVN